MTASYQHGTNKGPDGSMLADVELLLLMLMLSFQSIITCNILISDHGQPVYVRGGAPGDRRRDNGLGAGDPFLVALAPNATVSTRRPRISTSAAKSNFSTFDQLYRRIINTYNIKLFSTIINCVLKVHCLIS
jgi:hypothetical protein